MHIGLTGGIASGKSTASNWWRQQGVRVVDTDAIAQALTAPGGAAVLPLLDRFGAAHVNAEQGLNRASMRELVLQQPSALRDLEAILHPLIADEASLQAKGQSWVVFDVPLLVERGRWRIRVNRVLVIDCDPATQIRRGAQRPGWSREQVEHIVALQANRHTRLRAADAWINNSRDDLAGLHEHLAAIAQSWGWDVKESGA